MRKIFYLKKLKPTNVVLRESSVVDDFHFDKIHPKHAGCDAVVVSNPIYVIFNAQRLSSVGQFNVDAWIKSMNQSSSDSLKELRKHISDEDVCKFLKSRYCQKPSEVAAWCEYLSSNMDNLTAEVQQYVEEQQRTMSTQEDSSDGSTSKTE